MSSKLTKKKVSVAPPLPRTMKKAMLVFADGQNDGQILFDVVYEPDGMADPQSLAHVHCLKANKIVKAFMDTICDYKQEMPTAPTVSDPATEMDQSSNIIAPPRLVQ